MKMKKRNFYLGASSILLIMSILTGCSGGPTAESVLKDTAENLKKVESVQGTFTADMGLKMEESGVSVTMAMGMNGNFQLVNEPAQLHIDGNFHMEQMGLKVQFEMYMDEKEDKVNTYVKTDDQWVKSEAEKTRNEGSRLDPQRLFEDAPKLADETEKEGGKEVYVLTGKVDGKKLEKYFKEQMNQQPENQNEQVKELYEGIDFSNADIPMTMKIDKETKLPAAYEMNLSGLLKSVFDTMPEEEMSGISAEKCQFTFVFNKYNDVDKIEIPKEALAAPSMGRADINN